MHRLFALLLKAFPIILVISAGFSLRLVNLGYADYQGDEIKAFYLPEPGQSIPDFLFTQRKGPVQFIITGFLSRFDTFYENQFLMRIFFALAGCLALVFFYLLVASRFGKHIALYAGFFFATNGFLVGLGRIAQYQSYVILGGILALYFFNKAVKDPRSGIIGIYLGFICWAVALLSHFDALLIAPLALYFLWEWWRSGLMPVRNRIKHLIISIGIAGVPVLGFYIPFTFYIDAGTKLYWTERLVEAAAEKMSSSILLFQIYQPVYVLGIYILFITACLIFCLGLLLKRWQAGFQDWTPADVPVQEFRNNLLVVWVWFLLPFILMEVIIYQPGTHMYTYLIPAFILLGVGVYATEQSIRGFSRSKGWHWVYPTVISGVFLLIFLQSYAIFVDHVQEYPWENERFLFWTLKSPTAEVTDRYSLSMFGFPYYRNWEKIGSFIRDGEDFRSIGANEPDVVTNFYVRKEGRPASPFRYYISIQNPRSFLPVLNQRMAEVINSQEPVLRIKEQGKTLAEIFRIDIR